MDRELIPAAEVVLVGAGHAHVQLLRRWAMAPVPGVRMTLVLDRPEAVYSGMVPGFVAGDYASGELEIDAVPLARCAGAAIVLAAATGVDPVARRVRLAGRPALPYDVASLNIGASVRGLDVPGVQAHALTTRPIRTFVDRLDAGLRQVASRGKEGRRIVVVGGGAAGVELAFTLQARCRAQQLPVHLTVLTDGPELLPGYSVRAVAAVRRAAVARGIEVRANAPVTAVEPDAVICARGRVPADLVVWATGAAPLPGFDSAGLPVDADGFLRTRRTLQVEGHDDLFAVGDCATLADAPWVRRAGVYAVRAAPTLDANLRARLRNGRLHRFRPQRQTLALLHLGDQRALACKWRGVAAGRWVWRWKDAIDRRFLRRFQVLAPDGRVQPSFAEAVPMRGAAMACGGCAAKLAADPLASALSRLPAPRADPSVLVGLAAPDDVAAVGLGAGTTLLATIDGFRAFTDDPWLVGRVAAMNAVSDVFAKGGRPRHALALVTVPAGPAPRSEELLFQVLAGIRTSLDGLGVSLVGGHSTIGPELFVGLSVTGDLPGPMLGAAGAQVGDALVLTKSLGTGVVLAADRAGRVPGAWLAATVASMLRSNESAASLARAHGAHACTDVSGFGFAGHLQNLLQPGNLAAVVLPQSVPALPGARHLLAAGFRSTFHAQNAAGVADAGVELLFDPQTSGGLLVALGSAAAEPFVAALRAAGDEQAAIVARVEGRRPDAPAWRCAG